jgi:hypothetical protein
MGLGLWLAAGIAAFLLARIVPRGKTPRWAAELVASLVVAVVLGLLASALDFGGWRESDWRAAAFAFFGAAAAAGLTRLTMSA